MLLMRGIRMGSEKKRESEENAESDECEGEAEGSDPGDRKTRIYHFLFCFGESERVMVWLIQKKQHLLNQTPNLKIHVYGK